MYEGTGHTEHVAWSAASAHVWPLLDSLAEVDEQVAPPFEPRHGIRIRHLQMLGKYLRSKSL